MQLLKKSNCIILNICIESASPKTLKYYRKPFTHSDFYFLIGLLKKHDITIHNHGVIGAPGESLFDIFKTFLLLLKTSDIWHASILEPRPGADIADDFKENIGIEKYASFGKGNVFFAKNAVNKKFIYLIYRIMFAVYLLNPLRIVKILFMKNQILKYHYKMQYHIAAKVLCENLKSAFGSDTYHN